MFNKSTTLKIAQVTYSGFGGLGSVVFSLIDADFEHTYSWAIGFIGDQDLEISYGERCNEIDVKYAVFKSSPGRPYRSWWALKCWLDDTKPDVIICHSINSVLACRWHAFWHSIPLIVVEHTSNLLKSRSAWMASRVSMLVADRLVVLTHEYMDELKRTHGVIFCSQKVRIIPNGINIKEFYPSSKPPLTDKKLIRLGMAGRFSFSKRQDFLISVMEQLAILRPDIKFELMLAGDGTEMEYVQNLAAASQVADRIRFDGLLEELYVASWLRSLDIYVHATDGETLSTALLQAMATGLPIIASDVPGVRNLLGGFDQFGSCVPNRTDIFAHAILHYVENPKQATETGLRARTQVELNYNNSRMLKRYIALIHEIIA